MGAIALGVAISPIVKGVARLASEEAAAVCFVRLEGAVSAHRDQLPAALRRIANSGEPH